MLLLSVAGLYGEGYHIPPTSVREISLVDVRTPRYRLFGAGGMVAKFSEPWLPGKRARRGCISSIEACLSKACMRWFITDW